jgi:acyl carrier protein
VREPANVDTSARLKPLIGDLFNCDPSRLSDEAGPGQVPGWDSLGHVTLIAAVQ